MPASKVIVFGETLLDVFPTGPIPGGAPLNVARHLAGLGFAPLLISRIGHDGDGELILDALRRWGISTKGIQIDEQAPTGRVLVSGTPQDPVFEIPEGAAWDQIDGVAAVRAALSWVPKAVVFGTLVRRSEQSGPALDAVLSVSGGTRIVDLNLRAPWYDRNAVQASLERAQIVKMNLSELLITGTLLDFPVQTPPRIAQFLVRLFGLEYLAVTQGAREVLLTSFEAGELTQMSVSLSSRPVEVVDTVGAGDAFTAVLVAGAVRGWAPVTSLLRAHELAGAVCGIRGAVPDDNDFYESFLSAWEDLP